MTDHLRGKVAIITGASRGIGAAVALRLGKAGARIVVNYAKDARAAEKVVGQVREVGSEALAVQADLTDLNQIEPLVDAALRAFGRVDILVNNAGSAELNVPLDRIDAGHYSRQFDLNVRGLLFMTQAVVRHMPGGGKVINIGSGITRSPGPGGVVYTTTKAAVEMITKVLAKELGPMGITVNTVSPGVTRTDLMEAAIPPDAQQGIIGMTPLGRIGEVQDIAEVVAFVASDAAGWITGEVIGATGGL